MLLPQTQSNSGREKLESKADVLNEADRNLNHCG